MGVEPTPPQARSAPPSTNSPLRPLPVCRSSNLACQFAVAVTWLGANCSARQACRARPLHPYPNGLTGWPISNGLTGLWSPRRLTGTTSPSPTLRRTRSPQERDQRPATGQHATAVQRRPPLPVSPGVVSRTRTGGTPAPAQGRMMHFDVLRYV